MHELFCGMIQMGSPIRGLDRKFGQIATYRENASVMGPQSRWCPATELCRAAGARPVRQPRADAQAGGLRQPLRRDSTENNSQCLALGVEHQRCRGRRPQPAVPTSESGFCLLGRRVFRVSACKACGSGWWSNDSEMAKLLKPARLLDAACSGGGERVRPKAFRTQHSYVQYLY